MTLRPRATPAAVFDRTALEMRARGVHVSAKAMPRFRIRFALAGVLMASVLSTGPAPAQDAPRTPFVDHFGVFDSSRWHISDGWSNGEWTANDWRRSQVFRSDRGLALVLARQRGGPKPFSSGEIATHRMFRYGYFEARMRVPRGSGMVTGFFTYARPSDSSWDEVDIEILGRDTRRALFSYYHNGERRSVERRLGFDAASGWHTYGFEWAPDHIRWYVDGRLLHQERGGDLPIPNRPQRLYLHLWNSSTLTGWLGPIPRWRRGPWRLRVSCVAHAERYPGRPLCR
jgi:endo-1,3-1,4-beta-glycanase ExoK